MSTNPLTILAPTDFSRAARNSVNYAFDMARQTKARLILLHIYTPPMIISEVPLVIPAQMESEAYSMMKLKRLRNDLHKKNKNISIEIACECGVPADEIYLYTLKRKIDFVVMGLQGKGFIKEKLIGSSTLKLIQKSETPVLSIDKKVKFKNPKRIVFATDKGKPIKSTTLHPLAQLSTIFKSHVFVLNVVTGNDLMPTPENVLEKNMAQSFRNFDHSVHRIDSVSVVEGLNNFIDSKKIDMLVMIPHEHTFTERVLNGRQTKRMIYQSKIPLLTFHERKIKNSKES